MENERKVTGLNSKENITNMKRVMTKLTGNDIVGVRFTDDKYKDSEVVRIVNSSIVELPPDITTLKSIKSLQLLDCENLRGLPDNIGELASLRSLIIKDCPAIKTLPSSVGSLEGLKILYLTETGIEGLPETVGQLHRLEELSISGKSFKYLPDSIWVQLIHNPDDFVDPYRN